MFLAHISVPQFWENPEIQDRGESKMAPFNIHALITTSYDVITLHYRPQRKHVYKY